MAYHHHQNKYKLCYVRRGTRVYLPALVSKKGIKLFFFWCEKRGSNFATTPTTYLTILLLLNFFKVKWFYCAVWYLKEYFSFSRKHTLVKKILLSKFKRGKRMLAVNWIHIIENYKIIDLKWSIFKSNRLFTRSQTHVDFFHSKNI